MKDHWIDDADHYICPKCGFITSNPSKYEGCKCPQCGFIERNEVNDGCQIEFEKSKGKAITIKQLEEMYENYEKSLWREHEDVRGDDMVELGTALNLLQEELCLLGCWDDDSEPQAER